MRERDPLASNRMASRGAQVGIRFHTGELGAFDQAVEQGCNLGVALRARAVVIPPPEHDTTQGAFDGVVVEWQAWVIQEAE